MQDEEKAGMGVGVGLGVLRFLQKDPETKTKWFRFLQPLNTLEQVGSGMLCFMVNLTFISSWNPRTPFWSRV